MLIQKVNELLRQEIKKDKTGGKVNLYNFMKKVYHYSELMNHHFPKQIFHISCDINYMMVYNALNDQLIRESNEEMRTEIRKEVGEFKKLVKKETDRKNSPIILLLAKYKNSEGNQNLFKHAYSIIEEFQGNIPDDVPKTKDLDALMKKAKNWYDFVQAKIKETTKTSKTSKAMVEERKKDKNHNEYHSDDTDDTDYADFMTKSSKRKNSSVVSNSNKRSRDDLHDGFNDFMEISYKNAVETITNYHHYMIDNDLAENLRNNDNHFHLSQSLKNVTKMMKESN